MRYRNNEQMSSSCISINGCNCTRSLDSALATSDCKPTQHSNISCKRIYVGRVGCSSRRALSWKQIYLFYAFWCHIASVSAQSESLVECEGDCKGDDFNCDFGLACFSRSNAESVPGCEKESAKAAKGEDLCFRPPPGTLVYAGDDYDGVYLPKGAFPLGECEGDCDADDECGKGLLCFNRDLFEEVPGCEGKGMESRDYCYDPKKKKATPIDAANAPTAEPTFAPKKNKKTPTPTAEPKQNKKETPAPTPKPNSKTPTPTSEPKKNKKETPAPTSETNNKKQPETPAPTSEQKGKPPKQKTPAPSSEPPKNSKPTNAPKQKTPAPSKAPENNKQESTTTSPAPTPTAKLPKLQLINDDKRTPYSFCEGNCTGNDAFCDNGLSCLVRTGRERVPGCRGRGHPGAHFCYKPPPGVLVFTSLTKDILDRCEGSCTNDDDCKGDLQCFTRERNEAVPGCEGNGIDTVDYCFDNKDGASPAVPLSPTAAPTKTKQQGETIAPTLSPSPAPTVLQTNESETSSPSLAPSESSSEGPVPQLKILDDPLMLGLGQCEGGCTGDDLFCKVGFSCFFRGGKEPVPGCSGEGEFGVNYCVKPSSDVLVYVADDFDTNEFPLAACQGDCDEDVDCAEGLKCFLRDSFEAVPGCKGRGITGRDYCYDPAATPPPTMNTEGQGSAGFRISYSSSMVVGLAFLTAYFL